jgi:hypothetical protein
MVCAPIETGATCLWSVPEPKHKFGGVDGLVFGHLDLTDADRVMQIVNGQMVVPNKALGKFQIYIREVGCKIF